MSLTKHPEIELLMAKLQGYFPTPEFTDWQIGVWVNDISRYDVDVVAEAVEILGHSGTRGRPLQYADLEAYCEDVFRTRLRAATPVLTPGEFVEAAPEEVRAIIRRYWDRPGGDEQHALAEARNARESGDPETRVEAVRRLAAARIAAESERREHPPASTPFSAGQAMRTACGAAVGTRAVEVHGVWCCPNCGSPIDEGCIGGAA